jgi:2-amino-4-ketopentanoate thiolase alpha subunit
MIDAKKGDWVQIHRVILDPGQRPDTLPECTKTVPYEVWIKGFLTNAEAAMGDEVQIETLSGREILGTLVSINPTYDHGFGKPQKELLSIGRELRRIVKD